MQRVVISASRRTDIPAFYMPWFMECIDQGYFEVINTYNGRAFIVPATADKVHTIVFWSKNFGPFLSRDDGTSLTQKGYRLFFNFTINSPHPILEPKMPPLDERLMQLAHLAKIFGPAAIQWRFDPICFFKNPLGFEDNNLDKFDAIARCAADAGIRTCITSFVDLYRKVRQRLKNKPELEIFDPPMVQKVETIAALVRQLTILNIDLQMCCEKAVLDALPADLPVTAATCIPSQRLKTLHGPDISMAKDPGQRSSAGCQCYISKDIGSYPIHPCGHNCLFCYANPQMDG